jgi:DNA-binding transcriptional MerR regulator
MEIKKNSYSPADICQWFGIPRTTLFRWEALGQIPEAERNLKGERVYTRHHLREIAHTVQSKVKQQLRIQLKSLDTLEESKALFEQLYVAKFFEAGETEKPLVLDDLKGLAAQKKLSPALLQAINAEAMVRPVGDKVRSGIWEVLLAQDRGAAAQEGEPEKV